MKVFANATFWVFVDLDGPLGPILAPSWADLIPKWPQKMAPKAVQKVFKNWSKNLPPKKVNFEPILGPKMVLNPQGGAQANLDGGF